jgi:hypothetical protein
VVAELHIERKERSAWPWILLGLALLGLLLWYFLGRGDADDGVVADTAAGVVTDTSAAPGAAPGAMPGTAGDAGAVAAFLAYTDERRSRQDADLTHEYTADGIRRLAAALDVVARQDTVGGAALQPRLDSLRQGADALQRNAESMQHAEQARAAFTSAAGIMAAVQERRFPDLGDEVGQVREAAEAVRPGAPLLEQRAQVQTFFDRAAAALRTMTDATG